MWRKNREEPPPCTGWFCWNSCYGTDLNRNWDANHGGKPFSSQRKILRGSRFMCLLGLCSIRITDFGEKTGRSIYVVSVAADRRTPATEQI